MKTHGLSKIPEYNIWQHMLKRCLNPSVPTYKHYGGRGITVCERWQKDFVNFYSDLGSRPSRRYTLERLDNDGPYSPDNCAWATRGAQSVNKRNTVWVSYKSQMRPLRDWLKRLKISRTTYYQWLNAGYSREQIFSGSCRKAKDKRHPCQCGSCRLCRHRAACHRYKAKKLAA